MTNSLRSYKTRRFDYYYGLIVRYGEPLYFEKPSIGRAYYANLILRRISPVCRILKNWFSVVALWK